MTPEELIQHINQAHATRFSLRSKFGAGEQGAYLVEDEAGNEAVLKWFRGPGHIQRVEWIRTNTDALRQHGYPVPRYILTGELDSMVYAIQTKLPGSINDRLSPHHITRLIELNRIQRDLAPAPNPEWQSNLVRSVLQGWHDYCVIDSLRTHSPTTAALLMKVQEMARRWDGSPCRSTDIVHFDFHFRNMLVHADEISGVVDWDGVQSGDSVFDLVTLLFYSHDNAPARDLLWQEIQSRAEQVTVDAYIAHMAVRQIDWTIRFYDPGTVDHFVAVTKRTLAESASRYAS